VQSTISSLSDPFSDLSEVRSKLFGWVFRPLIHVKEIVKSFDTIYAASKYEPKLLVPYFSMLEPHLSEQVGIIY
jgi:hypothetical protein